MTHPGEGEISTDVTLDQPGDEHGFPRITQREGDGSPDGSVAGEIGNDGCRYDTDGHGPPHDSYRPPHIAPKSDQDA